MSSHRLTGTYLLGLEQVGGHDDSELMHAEELGDLVMSKVSHARRIPGGLEVTLTWVDDLAGVMDEYLSTHRKLIPDVDRQVVGSGSEEATLRVVGPEGFVQSYEKSLEKRGFESGTRSMSLCYLKRLIENGRPPEMTGRPFPYP